eukprot:TRINITY_DN67919_c4_g2_i1.p1 TRINITY_DN67919_c4_g2~~TRINITY_DN67919_c4_g2_i1.p1  ORF type:complete len:487 (+),score=236.03 TRINITY_DN67919_c4_g2_i1:37-1461(+)
MFGGDEVGALVLDCGTASVKAGLAGEAVPKCVFPSAVGVTYDAADSGRVGSRGGAVGDAMDVDVKPGSKAQGDGDESKSSSSSSSDNNSSASKDKGKKTKQKMTYFVGESALYRRDNMDLQYPVQNGLVNDWDALERIWQHAIETTLHLDGSEHPFMLAEASFNTNRRREKMLELAFETFKTPGAFLARSAVLAAFSVGKSTSLVLESGAGVSCAVPVHDGYVLSKQIRKTRVAGNYVNEVLEHTLFKKKSSPSFNVVVHPRFKVKRTVVGTGRLSFEILDLPGTTQTYFRHMQLDVLRDLKESVVRISEVAFDPVANANIPPVEYELPDGNVLRVGAERFVAGDKLFNTSGFELKDDLDTVHGFEFKGMHHMVKKCIDACDADIRRDLYNSIVLSGGNTLVPGFAERLQKELTDTASPSFKIKVNTGSSSLERQHSVWVGGSILGSLGTFHQMWFSKGEYEESGAKHLTAKCP